MTRHLFYSTISAASAVFMLLLMFAAGRLLGKVHYGDFMWVISLATIAEVFMDFGLHQITIRAIARDATRAGALLRTSLWLKVLPGIGMVIVFGTAAYLMRPEAPVRLASLIMLVSAAMRSYLLTARGVLLGLESFGYDALVTTADRLLLFITCVIALWAGASVVQLSLVFLAVRALTAIGGVLLARHQVGPGHFDPDLWRTLPGEAIPVGLFLLVLNLYNRVDTVMLGAMTHNGETGLYGAAYPVYEGLTYATAVLSAVLGPRLARLWVSGGIEYRRLVARSQAAAFLLALVIGAVAWPLADVGIGLFSPEFLPAATTLRFLLLGLPFVYVTWVLHAVAVAAHRTRTLLVVTAMGTVLNVALNWVLIPRYAHNGSAVATVISEVVAMAGLMYGLRSALRPPVA